MEVTELSKFLAASLVTPCGIPFMLILVDGWRCSRRTLLLLTAAIPFFHVLFCLGIGAVFGFGDMGGTLSAILSLFFYWAVYAALTRFRDGRFLFTVVTVAVLCTLNETICSFFFPFGAFWWNVLKIGLTVALSLLLFFVCRKPFLHMLHTVEVGWVRMCIIPICLLLCLNLSAVFPASLGYGEPNPAVSLVLCASIPVIYVSLSHMLRSLEAEYRAKQDSAVLLAQIQYLDRQTKRMLSNERKNSIFRHDLRHFIRLLDARMATGDYLGVQTLLTSIEEALTHLSEASTLRTYTGNVLLDTVFSLCADQAEEQGVEFSVRLTLPAVLEVDMTELTVVVSNALENALNGCRALPEGAFRSIRVYDAPAASQFFLAIDNTCAPTVHLDPKTGKPVSDRPGHGYGTASIASFAQKYGAVLTYSVDNGWFRLRLLI